MATLLQSLGLCRRAGKLFMGTDVVLDAVRKGKVRVVVLAADLSPGTEDKIRSLAAHREVLVEKAAATREELARALGKPGPLAAVAAGEDFFNFICMALKK